MSSQKCKYRNTMNGGVCGVMDTVMGNGHGDQSSNPRQSCWHFT